MPAYAPNFNLALPTLKQLNGERCERSVLLLLRTLNTSDLAWMYSLLTEASVRDICDTCTRLLDDCVNGYPQFGIDAQPLDMTPDEYTEAREYIASMLEHMDNIAALKISV